MKIFVIRHGETTGDVENRYGGDYDDHLSPTGEAQSETLAQELGAQGIEAIFVSPLLRAQETASYLAREAECPVIVEHDLKERNQYGILTGMRKEDAIATHPDLVELLKNRYSVITGAESYEDFAQRISSVFTKLASSPKHSTIAILWHGGPMRVLFRDILKWGELKEIGDCAFVELEKTENGFVKKSSERIIFDF